MLIEQRLNLQKRLFADGVNGQMHCIAKLYAVMMSIYKDSL